MIQPIQTTQTLQFSGKNNNAKDNTAKYAVSAGLGAVAGAAARYIIPTQKEMAEMIHKEAVDTFVSSAAIKNRGASRSILKYAGLGALAAAGLSLVSKVFPKKDDYAKANAEYSKLGAYVDAPDYAVEIMWYGE